MIEWNFCSAVLLFDFSHNHWLCFVFFPAVESSTTVALFVEAFVLWSKILTSKFLTSFLARAIRSHVYFNRVTLLLHLIILSRFANTRVYFFCALARFKQHSHSDPTKPDGHILFTRLFHRFPCFRPWLFPVSLRYLCSWGNGLERRFSKRLVGLFPQEFSPEKFFF